jgi:hypothetical protein
MALATGGSAVGLTRMRSRPNSCALRTAAGVGITSTEPSGNTALTSRARIASLTFSRILGRRGAKPLGGYMPGLAQRAVALDWNRSGWNQMQYLIASLQHLARFPRTVQWTISPNEAICRMPQWKLHVRRPPPFTRKRGYLHRTHVAEQDRYEQYDEDRGRAGAARGLIR